MHGYHYQLVTILLAGLSCIRFACITIQNLNLNIISFVVIVCSLKSDSGARSQPQSQSASPQSISPQSQEQHRLSNKSQHLDLRVGVLVLLFGVSIPSDPDRCICWPWTILKFSAPFLLGNISTLTSTALTGVASATGNGLTILYQSITQLFVSIFAQKIRNFDKSLTTPSPISWPSSLWGERGGNF